MKVDLRQRGRCAPLRLRRVRLSRRRRVEDVDGTACIVGIDDDDRAGRHRAARRRRDTSNSLDEAAERFDLDADGLQAGGSRRARGSDARHHDRRQCADRRGGSEAQAPPERPAPGARYSLAPGAIRKSVFAESENLIQQWSGVTPATSTNACFDPLGDLGLLLVGAALEPVDLDEGHGAGRPPLGERRLQLGLEATLGHRADDFLRHLRRL